MKKPDFYRELSVIIEDCILATIETEQGTAEGIADDVINNITGIFGGQHVYLRNRLSRDVALKHKRICAEFNGHNLIDLARKHRMTVYWVKEILKRAGK